jgi:hypothetical protein
VTSLIGLVHYADLGVWGSFIVSLCTDFFIEVGVCVYNGVGWLSRLWKGLEPRKTILGGLIFSNFFWFWNFFVSDFFWNFFSSKIVNFFFQFKFCLQPKSGLGLVIGMVRWTASGLGLVRGGEVKWSGTRTICVTNQNRARLWFENRLVNIVLTFLSLFLNLHLKKNVLRFAKLDLSTTKLLCKIGKLLCKSKFA